MRTNHTKQKKIYFRGTISSLFNAAISCSDYTKNASKKSKQYFLCVQTCKRSLMSATGRFSCRSRIAACTITSAWVSVSPKASASNITSFITLLRSAASFPKRREYMNSKNTTENTSLCVIQVLSISTLKSYRKYIINSTLHMYHFINFASNLLSKERKITSFLDCTRCKFI